jgi:hypothetical protein
LKHPVYIGGVAFGSKCARDRTGVKVRRVRKVHADERQSELFSEARA